MLGCAGCTHADLRSTVAGCPCSAGFTEGTAAWRAGMVTATLQAVELPLPEPMEAVLRALAAGDGAVADPHGFLLALRLREFVQTRGELLAVTAFGRAYLAARDGRRVRALAHVLDVDQVENTALLRVNVRRPDQRVSVLLEQLSVVTGVEPHALPGVELEVTVNPDAERQEEIVLTGVRVRPTPPLPETWRKTPAPAPAPAELAAAVASPAAPDGEAAPGD